MVLHTYIHTRLHTRSLTYSLARSLTYIHTYIIYNFCTLKTLKNTFVKYFNTLRKAPKQI